MFLCHHLSAQVQENPAPTGAPPVTSSATKEPTHKSQTKKHQKVVPKKKLPDVSHELPLPQEATPNPAATAPTTNFGRQTDQPNGTTPPEATVEKLALHLLISRLDEQTGKVANQVAQPKTVHLFEPDKNKVYHPRDVVTQTTAILEGTLRLGLGQSGVAQDNEGLMTLAPIIGPLGGPVLQGSFLDLTDRGARPISFTAAVHGTGIDMTLPNGHRSYEIIIDIAPVPASPQTETPTPTPRALPLSPTPPKTRS